MVWVLVVWVLVVLVLMDVVGLVPAVMEPVLTVMGIVAKALELWGTMLTMVRMNSCPTRACHNLMRLIALPQRLRRLCQLSMLGLMEIWMMPMMSGTALAVYYPASAAAAVSCILDSADFALTAQKVLQCLLECTWCWVNVLGKCSMSGLAFSSSDWQPVKVHQASAGVLSTAPDCALFSLAAIDRSHTQVTSLRLGYQRCCALNLGHADRCP